MLKKTKKKKKKNQDGDKKWGIGKEGTTTIIIRSAGHAVIRHTVRCLVVVV